MLDSSKVLIISGHTNLNESVANKQILADLGHKMPDARFSLLSELYSDYQINVSAEQAKLLVADIIVLQFPVFWYNIPSLLQKWLEDVFQHGFSHGSESDKLQGKKLILSFTTGAPAEAYQRNGAVGFEISDLSPNLIATSKMCGLEFKGYVYTGGVSYQLRTNTDNIARIRTLASNHADRLMKLIAESENK